MKVIAEMLLSKWTAISYGSAQWLKHAECWSRTAEKYFSSIVKQYFSSTHQYFASKDEKHFPLHMRTMCFLNKQTFPHNWRINIRLNGQTFRFKERTMFCYDLSQRVAGNILPQRANVLPQCLYDFYEYILPAKKFKFFDWFSLFCLNSI